MSAVSYARPRLITSDDKRYRAHVEQYLLQRKNQRAMRPPRQRDIFGGQAESTLREWLAASYSLSERRILEYEQRQRGKAIIKYRELDALVFEEKNHAWVFEIKASRLAASVQRAAGQLQETRAILRLLVPLVHTTVLLVDTGIPTAEEVALLMQSEDAPRKPPPTLAEMLEGREGIEQISNLEERHHDGTTIDVLCFSVDDIIALAGEENLALDWSDDDEEWEPPAAPTTTVYSSEDDTDDDDDEGGALAEALRRAGLS
jgi:hypothetical protein